MKWIATLTLWLALAGGVLAAGPDDDYLVIYSQIQQADALQKGGQLPAAAVQYLQARDALQKMHAEHPASNAAAVNYRLDYLADKLKELAAYLPSTNAVPAAARPVPALTPQQQTNMLQEQISALKKGNDELEMKLKEALSVQPAAVAPSELAKARERTDQLQRERDLLRVALDQQKAAQTGGAKPAAASADSAKLAAELAALRTRSTEADKLAQTEMAGLKRKLDESEKKLSDTTTELNNLKSRPPVEKPVADNVKQLTAERDKLKKELATVSKELADRESHASSAAATPGADAAKLKEVEKERDDLKKQIAALTPRPPSQRAPAPAAGSSAELERLRARLAVLEAKPVPYTAEELAVLKGSPSTPLAAPPVAVKESPPKAHSVKDLPAGAGEMMKEAHSDVLARRYDDAEKKYLEVLRQDENNVYVLVNLGNAQFAAHRLDDCEKNVRRALDLDPNDPGALYLLGVLRYGQEKLDDALDALSRSAAINSTNASTQNYLGCVLADKGLRPQAETALRKALEIDPDYPDAHFNLALVYARETPPSLALARWHYQRSVDRGHEKSASLEKMLSDGK